MIPPRNPYRAILRRDYPEPFIALLSFLLGIWLWDHYFGQPAGYPPGTEEIALVKIDRDLRLADAMAADPPWLRWLAGVEQPAAVRHDSLIALEKLAADRSISPRGIEAYAIIKAVHEGLPLRASFAELGQGVEPPDVAADSKGLAGRLDTWWIAHWAMSEESDAPHGAADGRDVQALASQQLRTRAIYSRSWSWLLCLGGLAFLPRTMALLKRATRARTGGYGGAWSLPLGLVVFLLSTLAWIGFMMTLELGIGSLPGLHPLFGILLDSAARLLPALIALGLLFRRASHAIRVMGLDRPLHATSVLGLFALLMLLDPLLRLILGGGDQTEPGGGLSGAEAGLWGLAFTIISACLLAPLSEELLYRGVLFRSFWNRLGVLPAAILSSLVFATLHFYGGYGLASVAIFGFACALLYAATRSLGACIILHILYNTSIKLPEWLIYHAALG